MRTVDGSVPIEQLRPGDYLLSRNEQDPEGPVSARQVEEVFVRQGYVLDLRVNGQLIRTTEEHPFYRAGDGWVAAWELCPGDQLMGQGGQLLEVESVTQTGIVETVYNVRVADWHTYFVGEMEWGWAVWAHNAYVVVRQYISGVATGHWSVEVVRENGSLETHQDPNRLGGPHTFIVDATVVSPGGRVERGPCRIIISDTQAMAATIVQEQQIANPRGPYQPGVNDCITHVCSILVAAGIQGVPEAGGSAQYRWLRSWM